MRTILEKLNKFIKTYLRFSFLFLVVITSLGISPEQVTALVQPLGRMYYGDTTNTVLRFQENSTYDFTFSAEESFTHGGSASLIRFLVAKPAITRDEIMIGALTADGQLKVIRGINGYDVNTDYSLAWSNTGTTPAMTCEGTEADCTRAFDVGYERLSGRAMVVYADTTNQKLYYALWNGTSWSPNATPGTPGVSNEINLSSNGRPTHVTLKPKSGSNEILMGVGIDVGGTHEIEVFRWDGDSWENNVVATDTTNSVTSGNNQGAPFDVEWDGDDAMVIYATTAATEVKYKLLTGGSWGSEQDAFNTPANGSSVIWLNAEADPSSNRIAVAINDTANDFLPAIWKADGTTPGWTTYTADTQIEGTNGTTAGPAYSDVQWERFTSAAIFVVQDAGAGDTGEYVRITCNGSGCTETTALTPITTTAFTDDQQSNRLAVSTNSNDIMYLGSDIDRILSAQHWNGSAWEAGDSGILEADVSNCSADNISTGCSSMPFVFAYIPYNAWSLNWRFFDDETVNDPSTGLNGAAENTAPTGVDPEEFIRLRINIAERSGQGQTDARKKLQYTSGVGCDPNAVEGDTDCTWVDVGDTSETSAVWRYATAGETCAGCADGSTSNTPRLTGTTTGDPEVFYVADKDAAADTDFDHNALQIKEIDFPLKAEAVSPNTTYYFRLYDVDQQRVVRREQDNDGNNDCATAVCTYPSLTIANITSLGDGTDGSNSTIAPGASATEIDRFSLVTSGGTDTVTGMTVTLGPANTYTTIATVDVQTTAGVSKCSLAPSSNTVLLTSCAIAVNTTPTEYKIMITPKTHANMPAVPGAQYAVTATVTSLTASNPTSGSDTDSATVTVDNLSPEEVTGATATGGEGQVDLAWTNPGGGVNGGPVKIDDTSNFGSLSGTERQVVRTSTGVLYAVAYNAGSCEVWKSATGTSWTQQDSADNPSCSIGRSNLAIDSTGIIHIVYTVADTLDTLRYITFDTSTDQFGVAETIDTAGADLDGFGPLSILVDSSNKPHILADDIPNGPSYLVYSNRVSGSWKTPIVVSEWPSDNTYTYSGMTINEDDIVEIVGTGGDISVTLYAYVGNANDATTFSSASGGGMTADPSDSHDGSSIAVDSSGNTWIGYINQASNYVSLIKHNDADAWTTWQTPITNSNVGRDPSIVIKGTDIYVFYENDQDDIAYDMYNGSTWLGETVLHTGTFQDVKAKWSYYNDNDASTQIDYLYSDATDVYWASLALDSDPSFSTGGSVVVLRRAGSAVADVPVEGTTYTVGDTIGTATVACVVNTPTTNCSDTSVIGGTTYHYEIFTKDSKGNYSSAGVVPTGSPVTPTAPGVTISGIIYSDEGTTPLTGVSLTVRVAKNGVLSQSTSSVSGTGAYTLPAITDVVAGDVLTVFVDSATASQRASAVTKANDSLSPISINLYAQRVIVRNENGVATTNTNMGAYDSADNANIMFTESAGNLTIASGNKLIIWTGDTFTPGGTVLTTASGTAGNPDGDVLIQSGATLSMGTNTLTVGGDFTNSGTFSYSGGQTTTFTATATGHSIEDGTANFDTLVFNGSGGGWTFSSAVTTVGNLTITTGNLTVGATDLTVGGNTSITGTLTISSSTGTKNFTGDVTVNASGTWNNSGNEAIGLAGNLTNNQTFTAGSGVYTMSGNSKTISGTISIPNLTVSGTVTNNGTLTVATALSGAGTLTNGTTAILSLGGTFGITNLIAEASNNLVNYTGSSPAIRSITYDNLTFSGSGIATIGGSTIVNATMTVSGIVANNSTLTVNGALNGASTLSNSATGTLNIGFSSAPGITTLTATASGNIVNYTAANPNCKVTTYNILNFTGSGTVTCAVTTVTNDINLSGTVSWTTTSSINLTDTLTVGNGTALVNGAYTLTAPNVTVTGTGTLTNNGTLTVSTALGGTGTVTNGASGTLNIGQSTVPMASGTLTASASGNIVNYTAANPNCKVVTYYALNFTGTGTVTCAVTSLYSTTLSGDVSWTTSSDIAASIVNVTVAAALINAEGFTLTTQLAQADGLGIDNYGTLTIGLTVIGTVLQNRSTGILNIGFTGEPIVSSIIATASGNTVNYTGSSPSIKPTTYHHLTINGSGTAIIGGSTTVNGTLTVTSALTNGSTLTVTGALEGASTLTNNSSGVLNIGFASTPGITTLTATASGNTVNYTAASPNCKVTTYHHLNFTGSGTVTCAVTTVNGNLATSGTVSWTTGANLAVGGALTVGNGTTLTQGSYTLSVSGNTTIGAGSTGVFVGSGNGLTLNGNLTLNSGATWTKGAGTVTFSKGAAQVITDSTASSQDLGNVVTSTASTAVSTASNIKLTSLNIAGSTSWDISNHTMTVTGTSNPLTISGTFTTTGSTVDFTGNGASPIPATTYNNLGLKPSGASQQVLGSGTFTIDGTFTVGDGVNAGATAAINNPVININGFGSVINSGAIFTHGNGAFNIKSFQVDGTFSGSGTGNILFDGGLNGSGTVTLTGADIEILHSLGCNGSGLQINGSNNWTIKKVTFSNGTGCDANIQLNTGFMGATLTVTDQLLIGKTGNSNMVTVAPSGTIILTSTGTPLVILSSPEARLNGDNATFRFIGNGATITSTPTGNPPFVMGSSYGNLELKPSGSTSQVLAAGTFTVNGSLIVGNGIHSGGADASINDPIINITSTLDIASNSTFTTGDGDMTISGGTNGGLVGTLSGSGTGTISINGNSNFYGEGIVNLTGGTFEFRPSGQKSFGTISGSSDWIFNNLTFGNSSEFGSLSIIVLEGGTGTITVNGNLLVGKSGDSHDTTLDAGNRTWILTNTGTPFVLLTGLGGNGVFDDDTSTFRFTGNGATIPALTYNNLELKPNGASPQVIGTGGLQTLGVVGNLTIGDGTNAGATASANNPTINVTGDTTIASGATLVSTSGNLTVGGNFTNNGTFTHNSGTVRFEGASKTASGNMIGTSAFNNLTLINAGSRAFNNNASTTNLTISSGTLTAPNLLSIAGNYSNSGTFSHNNGTTTFNGIVDQTLTGNMIGTSAFRNLEILNNTLTATTTFANNASTTANFYVPVSNARIEFAPSATTTLTNLIVNGQSEGNEVRLWSATPGSWWGLDVPGTRSISYMSVMDSRACSGNPNIIANVTILNAGNNSCWDFPTGGAPTISSAGNQVFTNGASATTISTITITDDTIPGITADNDLRIGIATSSVDMLWLTSDTTATLGGTASGKVSTTVSYEGGGSVLVIPVNTNFASGDTLTISGLSFISFGDANAATPALGVYTEGPGDITADAMDDKTVMIKGRMTLADHDAGQELNKFQITTTSVTGSELFAFKLSPFGENFSITNFVYTLIGIKGLNTGDFANVLMNIDYDGDGSITAGETQVGGEGVVNINGRTGTITFADDFTATTTRNYVLRADVSGIIPGDHLNVGLNAAGITTSGTVALQPTTVTGAIETVNHTRITYGTDVGGGVAGAGIVTGGGVGPGETIGDDPLLLRPTSTGSTQNQWTTPTNAYDGVNGTYATETAAQDSQDYGTFSFSVPAGNIIDGIEVKIEANGSQNAGTIDVALSWNGGTNVTSVKSTATLSATDTVYTLGGGSDKWGRTWSSSDFSNANFRLRITGQPSGNTISVDDIKVKVYHRASGGGSGGGGDIGYKSKPRSVANVFSVFEYLWNLFK